MNALVDAIASATGWSGSDPTVTAYAVNQIPEFIAGLNAGSLTLQFGSGVVGRYAEKTISFDLTGYDEVTFTLWSRNKRGAGLGYNDASAYAYKIDFGSGDAYYLPVPRGFEDVSFFVRGRGAITRIRITALTADPDFLIISNMVASKDQMPLDILAGIKEKIDASMSAFYATLPAGVAGKGVLIGAVTASAGDDALVFTDTLKWADRYAVVLIDDGSAETHQLDENDETSFRMTPQFGGKVLAASHAAAPLYLTLPCVFGVDEKEFFIPGISVWGMAPQQENRTSDVEAAFDTFKTDGTVMERRAPVNFRWRITLSCEARQNELLAALSKVARDFIARRFFWVNGKKVNVMDVQEPVYVPPAEPYNELPRVEYTFDVEVREEVYDRASDPATVTNNLTINIGTAPLGDL